MLMLCLRLLILIIFLGLGGDGGKYWRDGGDQSISLSLQQVITIQCIHESASSCSCRSFAPS